MGEREPNQDEQADYQTRAVESWGETVDETNALWGSYSDEEQQRILAEAEDIYQRLAQALEESPSSDVVQGLMSEWHQNLLYFDEPSTDTLSGLAEMYIHDKEFREKYEKIRPGLADFFHASITHYVDVLETRWLEQEIGILSE